MQRKSLILIFPCYKIWQNAFFLPKFFSKSIFPNRNLSLWRAVEHLIQNFVSWNLRFKVCRVVFLLTDKLTGCSFLQFKFWWAVAVPLRNLTRFENCEVCSDFFPQNLCLSTAFLQKKQKNWKLTFLWRWRRQSLVFGVQISFKLRCFQKFYFRTWHIVKHLDHKLLIFKLLQSESVAMEEIQIRIWFLSKNVAEPCFLKSTRSAYFGVFKN